MNIELNPSARIIAAWSARDLAHVEEIRGLTMALAGAELQLATLHGQLAAARPADGAEGVDVAALVRQLGDTQAALAERDLLDEELAEAIRAVAVARGLPWDAAHPLIENILGALASGSTDGQARVVELETWLKDREDRLAELEKDWEVQSARIAEMETLVAAGGPTDETPAVPPPLPRGFVLKPCIHCKKPSPMRQNGKYCTDCRDPKNRENQPQ